MPANSTRLLAVGDLHLGRRSGRLPRSLDHARLDPAAALALAVQTAQDENVRAVLLAGDVVDSDHDTFRGIGLLAGAVEELSRHDIAVYAVAGNHDAGSLPQLARSLPGLTLLGAGGHWEEVTIDDALRLRGWSFPGPRHQASPLAGFPPVTPGPPVIGLLHADLGTTNSVYAPVTPGELAAAGPVRWLLGHLHQPTLAADHDAPGYLGSLVGLDPTETGAHGPWLITIEGDAVTLQHLSQAPLYWSNLDVPVDDIADPDAELLELVAQSLRELAESGAVGLARAEAVGVRVRLTGRAADLTALERARRQLEIAEFVLPHDQQQLFVDTITSRVRPMHDLAALARADDLPGLLASELLALEQGEAAVLLQAADQVVENVDHQSFLREIIDQRAAADPDELRDLLIQSGYQALDVLLDNDRSSHGTP